MAIWPVDLPQYPTGPVMTELQDSRIRSQPDTGPPLMRRRYTSAIRMVEAPLILTGAQLAIFDAFYETDLLHGTQRFQWLDFRTDELVQYRFVEPPKWTTLHGDQSPANRRWQATLKLEILPGLFAGVVRNIAATLVGEAVLTANAGRLLSVSASLLGSSSLTAAPGEFLSQYIAATLTGNSEMTAAALATRSIAASLTGQATLTAGAELVPGGTVNAVELDGVGQHYVMDPLGTLAPAPGSGHTIHIWRQKALDGVEQALYWRGDITTATPVPEVSIVVRADNKVHAEWYDESGNLIGQVTSTDTFLVADGKVPIGLDISGDSATLRLKGLIDGVNAPPTAAGGYMGFGGTRYLGRSGDAGDLRHFMGCLAEDWEAPVSLGFNDDDIYEKFVDSTLTAGLAPRNIGADGSGPSDQVLVYLNGGYATYHQNQAPATGSVDYAPVGFIQPCADSFGVYSEAISGIVMPSIVPGSFANATFTTNSSANRTYLSDYDPGAGSNRKVIAIIGIEQTSYNPFSESQLDSLTFGGVHFKRNAPFAVDGASNDAVFEIGYIDEADLPAPGTNAVQGDTASNTHWSLTIFTVKDAQPGPFTTMTATPSDTSPLSLNITTVYDKSLVVSMLVIGQEITDVAASGSGHAIADNYDSGATAGERIVIGSLDAATAGAQTLGYTFTNSAAIGISFAIAPVDAYVPFGIHLPPTGTGIASSGTAHAVTMPATVAAGDALIVILGLYYLASAPAGTITTPSGWTAQTPVNVTNGSDSFTLAVFKKIADGTEDGATVDFVTSANATAAAHVYQIDVGTWYGDLAGIEIGTAGGGGSTSPDVGSITPSWGSSLWMAIAAVVAIDDDNPLNGTGTNNGPWVLFANKKPFNQASGAGANAGPGLGSTFRLVHGTTLDPIAFRSDVSRDRRGLLIAVRAA